MMVFAVAVSCAFDGKEAKDAANSQPNFLVIMADDCTFRDLEIYGGPARTPNLVRLAEEGMMFNRCFQATAMCAPTRQNLLTGLYPVKNGAYANHSQAHSHVKSIAHHLQAAGYRSALTGKRHIGPDEVYPFEYSEKTDDPDMEFIDGFIAATQKEKRPFALFAMCSSPHVPWTYGYPSDYPVETLELAPYLIDTKDTREAYAKYLAEISYFDRQVGQILQLIEKHGIENHTLVMVLGEHGSLFPFEKWTCYDAGLRSAMVVRYPGMVEAGTTTQAMVEYVDVLPTFLDLADIQPVAPLDGRSFKPVLTGQKNDHKQYVFGVQTTLGINNATQAFGIRSVRSDSLKLIVNLFPENQFENALLMDPDDWSPRRRKYLGWMNSWRKAAKSNENDRKTLNRYQQRPPLELYNVIDDPYELNNLADHPQQKSNINRLMKILQQWMNSQGDQGRNTELAINPR